MALTPQEQHLYDLIVYNADGRWCWLPHPESEGSFCRLAPRHDTVHAAPHGATVLTWESDFPAPATAAPDGIATKIFPNENRFPSRVETN